MRVQYNLIVHPMKKIKQGCRNERGRYNGIYSCWILLQVMKTTTTTIMMIMVVMVGALIITTTPVVFAKHNNTHDEIKTQVIESNDDDNHSTAAAAAAPHHNDTSSSCTVSKHDCMVLQRTIDNIDDIVREFNDKYPAGGGDMK